MHSYRDENHYKDVFKIFFKLTPQSTFSNKASLKYDFPLPHIDVLVDNTAQALVLLFIEDFSSYNQIKREWITNHPNFISYKENVLTLLPHCCTPNFDIRYHLPSASLHCKCFDLFLSIFKADFKFITFSNRELVIFETPSSLTDQCLK